jgi:predicted metal-dependent phosphoesterase TrpH
MSEPRATKKEIRAAIKKWKRILGLTGWEVSITFGKDEDGASAGCLAQPEYRSAALSFDLALIPASQVDRFACHELLHTLAWGLANAAHTLARGDAAMEEWVRTQEEDLVTALELIMVSKPFTGLRHAQGIPKKRKAKRPAKVGRSRRSPRRSRRLLAVDRDAKP